MSIYGGPDIVTDGLVLHLDAANRKSYPGSGTSWNDLSGNNKNGALYSASQYNTNGWMTNGGNGSPSFTIVNSVSFNTNISEGNTIEQFIYTNSISGNGGMPFTFYLGNLDIWMYNNYFGINNGASLVYGITNATNIFIGKWVYYACYIPFNWSSNYSSSKLWINGISQSMSVRQGSFNTITITASDNVGIGGGYNAENSFTFNGNISLTRIYNRELNNTEVLNNYNALKGRYGL